MVGAYFDGRVGVVVVVVLAVAGRDCSHLASERERGCRWLAGIVGGEISRLCYCFRGHQVT